ncbi:hypothetical protein ACFPYJ_12200 [Paenibacillus solisilvae]|uniref:Uncharacterized protein n=1 Tax=Paenibacillus solisilvae TaxID=2486751 RepID=A0ABW0VZE3_9BACL
MDTVSQQLTVATDTKGIGLKTMLLPEIIFIEYVRSVKGIMVHSLDSQGFLPGPFSFWVSTLQGSGLSTLFPVDRNNALNLAKIELLDPKFNKAYFEKVVTRKDKVCTIALANFNAVIQELKNINRMYKIV